MIRLWHHLIFYHKWNDLFWHFETNYNIIPNIKLDTYRFIYWVIYWKYACCIHTNCAAYWLGSTTLRGLLKFSQFIFCGNIFGWGSPWDDCPWLFAWGWDAFAFTLFVLSTILGFWLADSSWTDFENFGEQTRWTVCVSWPSKCLKTSFRVRESFSNCPE